MRETLAITGATGFLGRHVVAALISKEHPVVILKRSTSDLTALRQCLGTDGNGLIHFHDVDRRNLEDAFADNRVKMVVHCATRYSNDPRDALRVVEANLVFPLKLVECCVRHGAIGFVNMDTMIRGPVSPYALSKAHFTDWLRHSACERLSVGNVLLEHFYGPGDSPNKFVPYVVRGLVSKDECLSLTLGLQRRDFTYITDVVDAVCRVIERTLTQTGGFEEYQVGTGRSISIRDLVQLIQALVGNSCTRLEFGAIPYRKHELMDMQVDNKRIMSLGWSPKVSLEMGLKQMIDLERCRSKGTGITASSII